MSAIAGFGDQDQRLPKEPVQTSESSLLQNHSDELHFDPQKAREIHEEIVGKSYNSLSKEDVDALLRMRVLLCMPA